MSEFEVKVVRIDRVEKHPNADRLDICHVADYPVIASRGDFKTGDLGVYIPIDAEVPLSHESFSFLRSKPDQFTARIKAKKLRGVFSMGLLIPASPSMVEGQDVQEMLGITKYEPDESNRVAPKMGSGTAEKKEIDLPVYDVDGLRKFKAFFEGKNVVITEKIHGSNARFVFSSGLNKLIVGSRTMFKARPLNAEDKAQWQEKLEAFQASQKRWRRLPLWLSSLLFTTFGWGPKQHPGTPGSPNAWWTVAEKLNLEEKLKAYPDVAFYGEVYGPVQKGFHYGSPNEPEVVFFDAWFTKFNRWASPQELQEMLSALGLPQAPVLYTGPWTPECRDLAEGLTVLGKGAHIREGIVISTDDAGAGRRNLKLISESYLLQKE